MMTNSKKINFKNKNDLGQFMYEKKYFVEFKYIANKKCYLTKI